MTIISRPSTKEYGMNWSSVFGKRKPDPDEPVRVSVTKEWVTEMDCYLWVARNTKYVDMMVCSPDPTGSYQEMELMLAQMEEEK